MASRSDVCHNWAHQLKAHLSGGNIHFSGDKLYSYSTVIGQVINVGNDKLIYLLNDKTYSSSTSKHQSYMQSAIPEGAETFSLTLPTGRFVYGWSGEYLGCVDPGREWWRFYIASFCYGIVNELKEFASSTSIKNETECTVLSTFQDIVRFCNVTGYTTVKQLIALPYAKWKGNYAEREQLPLVRKALTLLNSGASLGMLVDAINGNGTYQKYVSRTSGARKMANTRKWNAFLGYNNAGRCRDFYVPYEWKHYPKHRDVYLQDNLYGSVVEGGITGKELEKHRQAGDLIQFLKEIRHKHLALAEQARELKNLRSRRESACNKLSTHVGIVKPHPYWHNAPGKDQCIWNGEVLNIRNLLNSTYINTDEFPCISGEEYSNFRKLIIEEQKAWIASKKEAVFHEYQRLMEVDAQRRAEAAERMRQSEIERAERQARYEADKKRLEELKSGGDDGVRQAYHEGLLNTISSFGMSSSLFFGGNTLMRYDKEHNEVVTSKGMRVAIEEAQRLWKLVCRWHTNKSTFQRGESARTYGYRKGWEISSYSDDIMVAGCHSIAYSEMKYIADTLGFASA